MRGAPEEEAERAVEEQRDKLQEAGVKTLRAYFLMDGIASKERLFVTEEMVEERIARVAQQQGKWPHEMREHLEQTGLLAQMRREMRAELVRDLLLKNAKVADAATATEQPK
jgi:trigger factor